ncbi:MAG: SbcC/MukB-like Walker B domain-containing protein, partial [Candidatus Eremiobacterota bacterium]
GMSQAASGQNPSRITYHAYVLGQLLEKILEATERRLARLSQGRFELRRGSHPLEVVVLDRFSGSERAVSTLSGGESFLASLALALGLSDTIQARGDRPPLGSLFVDEGFGYLDAEATALAFQALQSLSMEEGRLVAIVTQVEELRERAGTRLEVIPGQQGSEIRFN